MESRGKSKRFLSIFLTYLFVFQPVYVALSSASYEDRSPRIKVPNTAVQAHIEDIAKEIKNSPLSLRRRSGGDTRSPNQSLQKRTSSKFKEEIFHSILNKKSVIEHEDKIPESAKKEIENASRKMPVQFIKNKGQVDEKVRYYAKQAGATIWFTDDEIVFDFVRMKKSAENEKVNKKTDQFALRGGAEDEILRPPSVARNDLHLRGKKHELQKREFDRHVVRMKFKDSNIKPVIVGKYKQQGIVNYFIGNDPAKWRTNIPMYGEVYYENVYAGIDLRFYANNGSIEYDFIVHPGADPEKIAVAFDGIDGMDIDAKGDLLIKTAFGDLKQKAPHIYQIVDGRRVETMGGFQIQNDNFKSGIQKQQMEYGFQIAIYDKTRSLVIDPLLASTFIGGSSSGGDVANDLTIDLSGNIFVTGYTYSNDYPTTPGAYDTTYNSSSGLFVGGDVFVSKFNSNLTVLLSSTFIGGSDTDYAVSLAIDSSGNVCVVGGTGSDDYPTTPGVYDTSYNNPGFDSNDAFLSKLNNNLTSLLASTFLGGSGNEYATAIIIDSSGDLFITGTTSSSNYPTTTGAYDTSRNGYDDVFASKLDSNLTSLLASTFIGGSYNDLGSAIAFDISGNILVIGWTGSSNYPTTPGAYDTSHNNYNDVFLSKLDNNLTSLLASTFIGGSNSEEAYSLIVDSSGNIFVGGWTGSSNYPTTPGVYDTTYNLNDIFISKFNNNITTLLASTFLGGTSREFGCELGFESSGNIFVAGSSSSSNYPTIPGAYDTSHNGSEDVVVSKLSNDLSSLLASTFIGGSNDEVHYGLAIDRYENVIITGTTNSSNYPTTPGSYDSTHNGYNDVFVTKIGEAGSDYFTITDPNDIAITDKAINEQFQIKVAAKNMDGTEKTGSNVTVTLSSTNGRLSPNQVYVSDGVGIQTVSVNGPGNEIQIKAMGGGMSGESNTFNVGSGCLGSLGGSVRRYKNPLDGTVVYLNGSGGSFDTISEGEPNKGRYNFTNIPSGNYMLWATYNDGGESEQIPVYVGCEEQGESKDVNVYAACNKGEKTPVLLVPGIMGSTLKKHPIELIPTLHNNGFVAPSEMKIYDDSATSRGWEALKKELNAYGYEEGCTMFEVPYDWRLDIRDIVKKYLRPAIIRAKQISGSPKIHIIAHSMGGLVTRAYVQSVEYQNDIDRFAMIGTPNHGSGNAYPLWEGGDPFTADIIAKNLLPVYTPTIVYLVEGPDVAKWATDYIKDKIAGDVCKALAGNFSWLCVVGGIMFLYKDVASYIYENVPSLWQLMPTYSFLDRITGSDGKLECLSNNWLDGLNNDSNLTRLTIHSDLNNGA